jgi:hypothetical protein
VKPQDHRETFIITHETSYEVAPGDVKGTHASSGTLFRGRVVWTQKPEPMRTARRFQPTPKV